MYYEKCRRCGKDRNEYIPFGYCRECARELGAKFADETKISIIIPNKNEPKICKMTLETMKLYPDAQVIVSHDPFGHGKGWAIREGLKKATGDVIVFIDGDMDIHPRMIQRLLHHLDEFDIVVGKKDLRGFFSRRLLTILSRLYIYLMFGIKVDTQTGVKAFKRYALIPWTSNGFAFDIEILANARKAGFSMYQVTIDAEIVRKMKAKSIIKALLESLKIWVNIK